MDKTLKKFIKKVKSDSSIDWAGEKYNNGKKSVALDVLYLLGISFDEEKYGFANGFERFLKEVDLVRKNRRNLKLKN